MTGKWAWPKIPPQSPLQFWLAFQAIVLTGVLRILLHWVKLPRILHWLSPKKVLSNPKPEVFAIVEGYVRGILRRFPSNPRGCCLVRSLALYHFGRQCGYPIQFHCGVQRADGEFKGHAWLSLHREPFWEGGDPFGTHVVTYSYPTLVDEKASSISLSSEGKLIPGSFKTQESEHPWSAEKSVDYNLQERKHL